ncbi:unnamed protein product [Mycena citricolor]|uniref:GTP cyclohydrolase II n=1 Tax=Mycena citricolor TaxID=2018698 RepID=A0AAD2K2K6_9AGAR|nr:unnamed protein product [Mycena citricolor]
MHSLFDNIGDAALLEVLTAPTTPTHRQKFSRRDAALDPLLMAAAVASGPHVTRNHYHHDFFPGVPVPITDYKEIKRPLTYVSRQAPRRQRIQQGLIPEESKENDDSAVATAAPTKKRRMSVVASPTDTARTKAVQNAERAKPVQVKCMARTRIPTPHGPAFLHLYHNTRDNKEHLALVIDSAQYADAADAACFVAPAIRSRSLDAVWDENETEMDRIIRGAYVGQLSADSHHASQPSTSKHTPIGNLPPPLVRIHSECFTGETVGSMRCDCGEQLDEAIRRISQPVTFDAAGRTVTIPGRGAVVYMRQEGRGIGLLSKIRAYNLQDLGHDTVTANLMLGHQADERGYEIAAAIMRDLGLGEGPNQGEGVRLLTNNPDKVEALHKEGIYIADRVAMVPRSWQARDPSLEELAHAAGATLIGGQAVHGPDLDKYLRTKVLRMGHMLPLESSVDSGV